MKTCQVWRYLVVVGCMGYGLIVLWCGTHTDVFHFADDKPRSLIANSHTSQVAGEVLIQASANLSNASMLTVNDVWAQKNYSQNCSSAITHLRRQLSDYDGLFRNLDMERSCSLAIRGVRTSPFIFFICKRVCTCVLACMYMRACVFVVVRTCVRIYYQMAVFV